ncbi:hypothetical protein ACHAWF_002632 [Thalassiosira exigua]
MSAEEAVEILNVTGEELTPESFGRIYKDVWIFEHEEQAAETSPNPQAQLDVINQVKDETLEADRPPTTAEAKEKLTADQINFPPNSAPPGKNLDGASVATNFINATNQ